MQCLRDFHGYVAVTTTHAFCFITIKKIAAGALQMRASSLFCLKYVEAYALSVTMGTRGATAHISS